MATEAEILKILAEERNMRKAAERLFLSQPALSQRLQSIEKEWGAQLFIRSQKGLTATPAGELVIAYAIDMLAKKRRNFRNDSIINNKSKRNTQNCLCIHCRAKLASENIKGFCV